MGDFREDVKSAYIEGFLAGLEAANQEAGLEEIADTAIAEVNEALDIQFESAGKDSGLTKTQLKKIKKSYADCIKTATAYDGKTTWGLGDQALPVGIAMTEL